MSTRAEVIAEAREWCGTPFQHQARLKHVGCDCVGLIWGVGENCKVLEVDPLIVKPFLNYGRQPHPKRMRQALKTFFVPIDVPQDGDIAWIEWRESLPMHLALVATYNGRRTLIHCIQDVRKCVEHGFTDEWLERVNSYWSYPGLIGVD